MNGKNLNSGIYCFIFIMLMVLVTTNSEKFKLGMLILIPMFIMLTFFIPLKNIDKYKI